MGSHCVYCVDGMASYIRLGLNSVLQTRLVHVRLLVQYVYMYVCMYV